MEEKEVEDFVPCTAVDILNEYKAREKFRDVSILDEPEKAAEVYHIIDNFSNKRDLARQFVEVMPLYFDNAGLWWRWKEKEKRWIICDEVDIFNVLDACARGINIVNSKERTEIINVLKQQARKSKPSEPKKTWIQFKEEIVDVENGRRFEATSKHFIRNPIPHRLGRSADTPILDKLFKEWVGEEYVLTLYEILAYCLLPHYPIQRLFALVGGGSNGKTTYLKIMEKFLGKDNVCSTELDTLLTSRFEITRLHNKLACEMGETNFNEMKKTAILKKLTDGSLIAFEYKNKNPFQEPNYAKIIMATNNLPTTDDKTDGFYRRWLILDFPNQFSEQRDILDEIPEQEYENLAMKLIEILSDLLKKKLSTMKETFK